MQVVKKPDAKDWKYPFKCYGCTSELIANVDDLECSYIKPVGDEPGGTVFCVSCVVCGDKLRLVTDEIPRVVKIEAVRRHNDLIDPY